MIAMKFKQDHLSSSFYIRLHVEKAAACTKGLSGGVWMIDLMN